jgi:hypothetical protein
MALGLLVANLVSQIGLLLAFIFGYLIRRGYPFTYHFTLALPATFISMFSHCMIMFYFIGTGKQIKDLCIEYNLDKAFVNRTRLFKSKAFPYITAAIAATMLVTIIGGGVSARAIPPIVHEVLAYIAVVTNLATFVVESKYIIANNLLLDEISVSIGKVTS